MHVLLCWLIFRKVIINSLADRFQKFEAIIGRWAGDSPFYNSFICDLQFELAFAARVVCYPCSGFLWGLYTCHFNLDYCGFT